MTIVVAVLAIALVLWVLALHARVGWLLVNTRDKCSKCFGQGGGILGNENAVDGMVLCDYCTVQYRLEKGEVSE